MSDKKPYERLDDLSSLVLMTGRGLDIAKRFPNPHGEVGEYTVGDRFTNANGRNNVLAELKSDDIANRRPITAPFMNLNGKPRRGRYSRAIGKE